MLWLNFVGEPASSMVLATPRFGQTTISSATTGARHFDAELCVEVKEREIGRGLRFWTRV